LNRKIAVSDGLKVYKERLEREGYTCVRVEQSDLGNVGAVVIDGSRVNTMGFNDTMTKGVVINVEGKTPEDVVEELKNRT
jgi:hypothetical protein